MTANTLGGDDDRDTNNSDEREEELQILMDEYNINREKAERVKKLMERECLDAEEAVERMEE